MTRRIEVFLPKLLPGKYLSPNRGERKEGRVPQLISQDKRQMRGDVCLGLLADAAVRASEGPFQRAHLLMELRWWKRSPGRPVYLPDDPGNAAYCLKAAIDGVCDAGLLPDDSYRHVAVLSTSVARVGTLAEEGLYIVITELEEAA